MNLQSFLARLANQPDLPLVVRLPGGRFIPPHFHVTEVGHVAKKFVDCGGTFRDSEACVLQAYVGSPQDDGHRLTAGKLAGILALARPILPGGDLPVEVEYEDDVISQFPLAGIAVDGPALVLQLGSKHTDCLAREKCGLDEKSGCTAEPAEPARCCSGAVPGGCC